MRIILASTLALLLPTAPLWAGDREMALAVVAQAVKAHGGETALAKMHTYERRSSGRLTVGGKEVAFKEECTAQLPDRCRRETEMRVGERKLRVLVVVNGDQGWQSSGGAVLDVGAARRKELREEGYAQWLTTLLPLTKEASLQLAALPEVKVNGEPAQGVKVSSKGHADVKLYFDKKSHLLVRTEREATEAGDSAIREETYASHKEFDGVRLPTKVVVTVGGKKFRETSEAAYTFPGKPKEGTFAKP